MSNLWKSVVLRINRAISIKAIGRKIYDQYIDFLYTKEKIHGWRIRIWWWSFSFQLSRGWGGRSGVGAPPSCSRVTNPTPPPVPLARLDMWTQLAQKQAFCLAGYLQPNKEWLSRLLIAYLSSSPLKLFLLASSKPAAEVKPTPPPLSLWCLMSPTFVFPVCLGFCLSFIMPVEIIYLLLWGVSVTLVYLNFPSFLSPLEFKIWNHIYKYTVLPSLCVFIFIVALSIR